MSKTVIVVGAAGGVGLEVVKQLAAKGYGVVGTVLDAAEGARLRAAVPGVSAVVEIDLSNADTVAPALSPVAAELGDAFAGIIVCAAISPYGPLETTPLAGARRTLEINTISDLAIYQACLPHLRQTKGRLVFLSSFGGKLALPFIGHYVTSKFALEGMCDVMRREAARFGVPVIVVEPGGIKTTMVTNQLASIVKDIATLSPEQAALYGDRYREFHGMLAGAPETANEPDLIAGIVIAAFEDPTPQARYTAGPDAAELVALARRSTDAELDAFLEQMYGASAAG